MLLIPEPRSIQKLEGRCPATAEPAVSLGCTHLPAQGYRLLASPDGVRIEAADESGAYYARQTWDQIAAQAEDGAVPALRIEDWPDFPVRGYMLDISRDRVPTMAHLRRLVDTLAKLRYNQLQLYTEHTFAYAGHEVVWGMASPMTPDEIETLDGWCQERHIELVANQNSLGHMERWLQHPEYHSLAECPEGFTHPGSGDYKEHGTTLRPNEASLQFLNGLYGDLLPHFKSTKFNIGGDEPWELGQGWSKPLVQAEGKHLVYARFLRRVCELAQEHGAEPMCWADVLLEDPGMIEHLPAGVTPIIWGYQANHPYDKQCETLAALDRPFQVAPGDSTWSSFTGRLRNMRENVRSAARHGLRHGASGLLMTHWGDYGHPQPWTTALPGLVTAAVFSWHGDAESNLDLTPQLNQLFFQDDAGVAADILLAIADVDHMLPVKSPYWSVITATLRWEGDSLRESFAPCTEDELRAVVERCAQWRDQLRQTRLQADDANWLLDELALSADFTAFAARRCLAARAGNASEPVKADPALRAELSALIGRYETCWLRRSRIGGLHESSALLRKLL